MFGEHDRGRIIALDYGKRRIGAAITDELGITAQSLKTLLVRNKTDAIEQIGKLVKNYNPVFVVLGLPRSLSGEIGQSGKEVQAFGTLLEKRFGVSVTYFDEWLTSKQAERVIREMNKKPSRNKEKIDSLSAVFILQTFLEHRIRMRERNSGIAE